MATGDATGLYRTRRLADEDHASKVAGRVGGLQSKLCALGVTGEFGHAVESAKNARRGRRACPTASLGAHTRPWRVSGAHVVGVRAPPGDRVGGAVSVVTL